jgi:pimeloyl-ACP methyl ester carboxylesterase
VQTALAVDEMKPLCRALATDFRVWHVQRPGYGTSGPARTPGEIAADADLVASVVEGLDLGPACLVGASYSAAVVLALASRHPEVARSLVIVEPPPYGTPGAPEFRGTIQRILDVDAAREPGAALDEVMRLVDGPDWRANAERDLPGSVAAMERDAATFFEADLPALLSWSFDDAQARAVAVPTLLVGGDQSHEWFGEMLDRLERVLPTATRVTVDGAGHSAALTHPHEVAAAVRAVSPRTRASGREPDRS